MRLTALLAVACLLALAVAGCSGKDGGGAASSSTSASSSSHSGSGSSSTSRSGSGSSSASSSSSSPSAAPNHAPTGAVSVIVNGTAASFNLTGADADGDSLSWTLSFGDGATTNGTTLPSAVTHTYAAAGNFSANYTLTDGKDPASYNVTVQAAAAGAGTTQTVDGKWTFGPPGCGPSNPAESVAYPAQLAPLEGISWIKFDVDPGTIGKDYTATFTNSPAYVVDEIDFYDADGGYVAYMDDTGSVIHGTVPDGVGFAVLYACDPAPGSVTYTAG